MSASDTFPRMTPATLAILLLATLVTATISGIFGMAGGLILMGVLAAFTPVAVAMVMHGFIQIVSNGSRAVMLWKHISWGLTGRYAMGALAGAALVALIAWRPSRPVVFVLLGLTPMLVWVPTKRLALDVTRRAQAEVCGFLVQATNTLAGVAGPLLDLFFVKTMLPRQTVVATKASTQVLAHAVKIVVWGTPLLLGVGNADDAAHLPPWWLYAAVIPLSIGGTWLGGMVLDRMTDTNFRTYTKWIVTCTGVVYLARGIAGFAG
jgi:uncharacterized protein